jgi:hypothetical protein
MKKHSTMESLLNLQSWFVSSSSITFQTANIFLQIIYPFTLTTAYFSMPQELVPFKLNSKSFVIAVIVVMAVVRLSFSVLGTLPRRPRWIMKFTAWAKTIQLNGVLRLPPGGGALSDRSTATEPVEMTLGV